MTAVIASLFADKVLRTMDRLVATLEGLDRDAAAWRPIESTNSVAAIVNHALANVEENVLSLIGGAPTGRDRSVEFDPGVGPTDIVERWTLLRPRVAAQLDALDDASLLSLVTHERRGQLSVAELLLVILRHLGEHEGEAMLTRSLAANA